MKGKVVLMQRGDITFLEKARLAQSFGALGVIVIQSSKIWPYTMTDQTKQSGDLTVPSVMISQVDGKIIHQLMEEVEDDEAVEVRLFTRERKLACPVCQDDFELEEEAVKLPCSHYYHLPCITTWLKQRNTCPLCRFELPMEPSAIPHPPPPPPVRTDHTLASMIS